MADQVPYDAYPPGERRPRPLRNALLVALVAFVLGAALVTWALTRWEPARRLIAPAPAPDAVAGPAQAVPSQTAAPAVQTLAAPASPPVAPEAMAVSEARVAGLESRLAQLDIAAAAAGANAARAEGLMVAFAARRAIDRGMGLGYIEGQLRGRFATTQPRAVAAVIAAAQAPVTLDSLRQELDRVAPALVGNEPGRSWMDGVERALTSLIIVRHREDPSPSADARLSRIRTAIDGGQVDVALAEVARLPARAKADAWMTSARRYIEAHRALDILEAASLTSPQLQQPAVSTQ